MFYFLFFCETGANDKLNDEKNIAENHTNKLNSSRERNSTGNVIDIEFIKCKLNSKRIWMKRKNETMKCVNCEANKQPKAVSE